MAVGGAERATTNVSDQSEPVALAPQVQTWNSTDVPLENRPAVSVRELVDDVVFASVVQVEVPTAR